jgi:sialate O-acetylesterase
MSPVLTVQLNRKTTASNEERDRCWGKVREAQRQAAKQIPYVFVIPSTDCTLSDHIHNSSASYMVLGIRLAATALNRIYGRESAFDAPDIAFAGKTGDNGIILKFDNITRLKISPTSTRWRVLI